MEEKIEYTYYVSTKDSVTTLLSNMGVNFNWSTVSQNSIITAAQILEIQNAVDVAHNAINTGCSSRNGSYQSGHNSNHCSTNKGPGYVTYNGNHCSTDSI